MKSFIFKEIMILSRMERKARRISFHPERNIILGKNDTGKSSLIKSIYAALGATAAKENTKWKDISTTLLLKFTVSGLNYVILKDGNIYSVFDQHNQLIHSFDSVTKGLGPYLATIFNFQLKLADQKGKIITPPPAFCFLPYYIDQDVSWQKPWESFKNLQQIKAYKRPMIEYHTGLRPDDFYEAKSEMENFQQRINELDLDRRLSRKLLEKIKNKLSEETFDIDIETFQEEVKGLLVECQQLKFHQEEHKRKLMDLYNSKINLETQILIAERAIREMDKDYNYATTIEDDIECPTCGAHYDNSFSERFDIAIDEKRTAELQDELQQELAGIRQRIKNNENKFNEASKEIERIELILEEKKGEIRLRDIIEKEGKKELNKIFQSDIDEIEEDISFNALEKIRMQEKLDKLEDKKRKESIRSYYKTRMQLNLHQLDVTNLSEKDYSELTKNINNTGSAGARMLVAYYFAIFQVMEKFKTGLSCPIVIDSPNQQAQDQGHVDKIYNFIKDNQPKNSQLILGLEELYNVDFGGKIIDLTEKYSLLNGDEFDDVFGQMNYFMSQTYKSDLFS
jgi:hypothetical protein